MYWTSINQIFFFKHNKSGYKPGMKKKKGKKQKDLSNSDFSVPSRKKKTKIVLEMGFKIDIRTLYQIEKIKVFIF